MSLYEPKVLRVIKVPSERKIVDKKPNFPPLDNLELQLLENKNYLKDGLPLIPLKEIDASKIQRVSNIKEDIAEEDEIEIEPVSTKIKGKGKSKEKSKRKEKVEEKHRRSKKDKHRRHRHDKKKRSKKDRHRSKHRSRLEEELGEEDEQDVPSDESYDEEEEEEYEEEDEEDEEEEEEEEQLTPEQIEEREREDYLRKFALLKKKYKSAKIPDFNEHSNLDMMKKTYDRTVFFLKIDSSVSTYRKFLICGFMFIEYSCTEWFAKDMKGFTKHQVLSMNEYDSLLVELGEKSNNNLSARLPVEVRLIGLILLQAGMFFIGKVIAEKAGDAVASFFTSTTPSEESENKPKMRGPSISVDEIRKMKKKNN